MKAWQSVNLFDFCYVTRWALLHQPPDSRNLCSTLHPKLSPQTCTQTAFFTKVKNPFTETPQASHDIVVDGTTTSSSSWGHQKHIEIQATITS